MTLLLTCDLNGNHLWYDWLFHSAKRVDAVCVAGDLTDPRRGAIRSQRESAEYVAWQLGSRRVSFFACEGDQDLWGARWYWLKSLTGTRRAGDVAVTSVPWKCQDPALMEIPRLWAHNSSASWIVLEHEPPPGTAVAAGRIANILDDSMALAYEPDYVVSGHMRSAPWFPGGSWWDKRGETILFNPGYDPDCPFPCHILLDTSCRTAIWQHSDGFERIDLNALSSFPNPAKTKKNYELHRYHAV